MQTIEIFNDYFCIVDHEIKFYSDKRYSKAEAFTILLSPAEYCPFNIELLSKQLNDLLDMKCDDQDVDSINEEILNLLLRVEKIKELINIVGLPQLN